MCSSKNHFVSVFLVVFILLAFAPSQYSQDKVKGNMVVKIVKEKVQIKSHKGIFSSICDGEIVYSLHYDRTGLKFKLKSIGLICTGVPGKNGKTGTISIALNQKPGSHSSTFTPRKLLLQSSFVADIHYPLIDRIKGYIKPEKTEKEMDIFRSYTETFTGKLAFKLKEKPKFGEETAIRQRCSNVKMAFESKDTVLGEVTSISMTDRELVTSIGFIKFFIPKCIRIQPVFIKYTPETGCSLGGDYATTGGSLPILRDAAIEMWNRCCIKLQFLDPTYVTNDSFRIVSIENVYEIIDSYDTPDAIEVFFVETSDPLGMSGGGVCFSVGSANAKVMVYDANLPINVYNLAHELGHALGLSHPPGNSTPGSLMEPSGFCLDNPEFMSDENCNNASNPLLHYCNYLWFKYCTRDTNM